MSILSLVSEELKKFYEKRKNSIMENEREIAFYDFIDYSAVRAVFSERVARSSSYSSTCLIPSAIKSRFEVLS
ncbi:MAG TPA: hypothetical protein VIH61_00795 [Waddliaceae bacterium]